MSKCVLVAYGTKSGSTAEVAEAIGQAMAGAGVSVDVHVASDVRSIAGYDAVVLGGPQVSSVWHPEAIDFLHRLHTELAGKPVAYFITSMTLTRSEDEVVGAIPIFQDPAHSRLPQREGKLGYMEKRSTPEAYLPARAAGGTGCRSRPGRLPRGKARLQHARLSVSRAAQGRRPHEARRPARLGAHPLLGA